MNWIRKDFFLCQLSSWWPTHRLPKMFSVRWFTCDKWLSQFTQFRYGQYHTFCFANKGFDANRSLLQLSELYHNWLVPDNIELFVPGYTRVWTFSYQNNLFEFRKIHFTECAIHANLYHVHDYYTAFELFHRVYGL